MPVDQAVREALDLSKLRFPSNLPVIGIDAEDYTDSTGDEALRVRVLVDESVDVGKGMGDAVWQVKTAIRDSLRARGVTRFPYIFLAKPSDLVETDD
jgi:hypothetical protein